MLLIDGKKTEICYTAKMTITIYFTGSTGFASIGSGYAATRPPFGPVRGKSNVKTEPFQDLSLKEGKQ